MTTNNQLCECNNEHYVAPRLVAKTLKADSHQKREWHVCSACALQCDAKSIKSIFDAKSKLFASLTFLFLFMYLSFFGKAKAN